ncbi:hypothetical protein [Sphingomonas sp. NFX23]|uniref:hypothetical protein n=1 Tax=Sphingomonas sp. NFX23 TaxID=2819532 RepID=UPI003CF82122
MLIDEKIYARLALKADDVYPIEAPNGFAVPCVVYNILTETPVRDISEDAHMASFVTLQVDVYGLDTVEVLKLGRVIRRDFLNWADDDVTVLTNDDQKRFLDNTTDVDLFRMMLIFKLYVRDDEA